MKPAERIALDTFLNEYPMDKSYDEIIRMLENEDESVVPQEYFTDWHTPTLAEFIHVLKERINNHERV